MIKLVCYGSKVLHLKEAYHSYVGEKSFTTIKVITANKIDGHNLSDLQVDLHIIKGIYNDPITLSLKPNAEISEAEVILEDKYTVYEGVIGFYLQFNKIMEDSGKKIIGKTNSVFIDVLDNAKVEKKEEPNNTNNSFSGFSSQGSNGKDGKDGKNGITYTPSISEDGMLSWTNDGGLPNPTPIKVIGKDGMNGTNGADGKNGQDYILTEADKQDIAQIASENIKEKDPTVSEWAKQPNKPTYSADEVGAVPKTRKIADIDLKDDITVDELMESLSINQKLNYKVLNSPTTELTRFYEYIGTLAEENWISLWEGSIYISLKYIDRSNVVEYQQFKLFANNTTFYIRTRTGTKNEQGEIEWSDWGGGCSHHIPYQIHDYNGLSSLFTQKLSIPKLSIDEYYPVVSQVFVSVTVPQIDKTTGTEILPIGNYFMVGDIANDQIGCWSLTDNQSYTITRTKDESGVWHYSATSSKSYVDEKIGSIDTALDEIIAQQESIIAIQNALMGGESE